MGVFYGVREESERGGELGSVGRGGGKKSEGKGSGCYICGGPHLKKDCPQKPEAETANVITPAAKSAAAKKKITSSQRLSNSTRYPRNSIVSQSSWLTTGVQLREFLEPLS